MLTKILIDFINKLSKVILFYYAITKFIDAFDMILFNETLNSNIDLIEVIRMAIVNKEPQSIQLLQTLWTNDILPAISLLVSVLTFIPILLYFFVINIKMICTVIIWITPGINVITFLYWIFKKHDVFKVYKIKNDEAKVILKQENKEDNVIEKCKVRKIENKVKKKNWLKRIFNIT